jgi:hypothetical protein
MRNNWILTPFEIAILIGATTLMIGGFVMVSLGLIHSHLPRKPITIHWSAA